MDGKSTWLLLVYTVPREPSASRVYVWRKLKRLGAIMLQDAVWLMPATSVTREQLQWLAAEIKELHGTAMLWESKVTLAGQEQDLIRRFDSELHASYRKLLAALKSPKADLPALSRRYLQLQTQDHFHSELGRKVRAALIARRGGGR